MGITAVATATTAHLALFIPQWDNKNDFSSCLGRPFSSFVSLFSSGTSVIAAPTRSWFEDAACYPRRSLEPSNVFVAWVATKNSPSRHALNAKPASKDVV